jgi:hypothetical protein
MVKTYLYREASPTTELLDAALANAQAEFKPVKRNRKGPYGMFADLCSMQEATHAGRAKYELAVSQYTIEKENGGMTLVTELAHKGEFRLGSIPIPPLTNPQHVHSYVTYMTRLGYARILCLAVDDAEDGEDLADVGADSGPLDGLLKAIAQATTSPRIEQLAKSMESMGLNDQQKLQARDALNKQQARVDDMESNRKRGPRANPK